MARRERQLVPSAGHRLVETETEVSRPSAESAWELPVQQAPTGYSALLRRPDREEPDFSLCSPSHSGGI